MSGPKCWGTLRRQNRVKHGRQEKIFSGPHQRKKRILLQDPAKPKRRRTQGERPWDVHRAPAFKEKPRRKTTRLWEFLYRAQIEEAIERGPYTDASPLDRPRAGGRGQWDSNAPAKVMPERTGQKYVKTGKRSMFGKGKTPGHQENKNERTIRGCGGVVQKRPWNGETSVSKKN